MGSGRHASLSAGQPSPLGLTFMLTLHGGRGSLSIRKADNFRVVRCLAFCPIF